MALKNNELLPGTLDLLILHSVEAGPIRREIGIEGLTLTGGGPLGGLVLSHGLRRRGRPGRDAARRVNFGYPARFSTQGR